MWRPLLSPHGAPPTAKTIYIHRERKAQGTLSPNATATSARGSGQGRLPEKGIHNFILSLGDAGEVKLKSRDLQAQAGVESFMCEHKNPQ